MKTLLELKNEHAKSRGCSSWTEFNTNNTSWKQIEYSMDIIAHEYAKQVATQALEDASENVFRSTMFGHNADLSLITNTPIILP